ncbi:aluminum-activated malate transporter 10-like [Panicum miliaceum]|uniref:Aluminum-activated malate transporter 10-like n=1 Tax=Panicum miliaceum TaxID=4540 RepID=A0A3L6PYN5_PANMI|nr:aluminum-activated malate transporter 10-like [Panicum miliaceum]
MEMATAKGTRDGPSAPEWRVTVPEGASVAGLNRAIATASAAVVALGVHWIASKSGDKFEPFIRSGSVFLLDYFAAAAEASGVKQPSSKAEGYRCVLNSKASEDSQANLARWEPPHGRFGFRHPYGQYRKVGAAMRHCAYCVEALVGCVRSAETQAAAPGHARRHLADACTRVAVLCARVLREASGSVSAMTTSTILDIAVADMNAAVQELQADMRALPSTLLLAEAGSAEPAASTAPLIMDAAQLFTVTSLLIEVSARIEGVVDAVNTLASLASFKSADEEKPVESATKAQRNPWSTRTRKSREESQMGIAAASMSPHPSTPAQLPGAQRLKPAARKSMAVSSSSVSFISLGARGFGRRNERPGRRPAGHGAVEAVRAPRRRDGFGVQMFLQKDP